MGGDAVAGGADDPERHQSAALRDAQGDHGREEERDPKVAAAGGATPRQRIVELYVPEKAKKTRLIQGSPAEAANRTGASAARRRAGHSGKVGES